MSFRDIMNEFPLGGAGIRHRRPFQQGERIRQLNLGNPQLLEGACYCLCILFAQMRLQPNPGSFDDYVTGNGIEMAVRTQAYEKFEVTPRALRIPPYVATVTEREFGKKFCLFRVNTTLRNNLEIIDAIIAARAVSMLVLRQNKAGPGHAIAFDTRVNLTFFDPNYGWFQDNSAPVGAAFFRDWYHRFYHASFYKDLFEHGQRQLVTWTAAA